MPSMTSKSTTSPRPFSAQRCARVPPIIPAPMSATFFRGMAPLKPKTRAARKSSGFEPPAREAELDRVKGVGADDLGAAVRAGHHPVVTFEAVDLERAEERVDDPQMLYALARIDAHLPTAIDPSGRRRDRLAHPVGRHRERGHVPHDRQTAASPPGDIGDEDVLTEVQLRLEDEPPTARALWVAWWATERGSQITHDDGRRVRVRGGRSGARDELAIDDLRDHRVGDLA